MSSQRYRIINIHRNKKRNFGINIENLFYAELRDSDNNLIIGGTLNYILDEILVRNYILENDK